jgi:hypothetical protein
MAMSYKDREELKHDAWKKYELAETIEQKLSAIKMVIFAHYERSRQAYGKKHPVLFEYSCHWVHSVRPNWFGKDAQDVRAALEAEYPKPASLHIIPGHSYWQTKVVVVVNK